VKLVDLIGRPEMPEPWVGPGKIPWDEEAFSARMLREHLSQEHDAASRRSVKIDEQVAWIHNDVLGGRARRVLDLGCGPGLYASRLAALGHSCVGIDFGPAAVRYARQVAAEQGLDCTYHLHDIRTAGYGSGYDLAMLLYGEFNTFSPDDARAILTKACAALREGGRLVIEPHPFHIVEETGRRGSSWYASESGLMAAEPHLCLTENTWDAGSAVATTRFYVVDAASGQITPWAISMQAYTDDGYRELLQSCGFDEVTLYPSLIGVEDPSQRAMMAIVARKAESRIRKSR